MKSHKLFILVIIFFFVFAVWLTYQANGSPRYGIDDANIFFSYAENLISGKGITYANNPEPVEGFTSMLWMLVCAFVFLLGGGEFVVLILCIGMALWTQWILLSAFMRLHPDDSGKNRFLEYLYLALIIGSPAYLTWMTMTLMDTCLWGLVTASMAFFVLCPPVTNREKGLAVIPFVLAPVTRPEGMLVAPVFLVLLWLRLQSQHRKGVRICLAIGGGIVFSIACLTVFRLLYFGFPLPNTYYAKVSPSWWYNLKEGWDYLYEYLLSSTVAGMAVIIVFLLSAFWLGRVIDRRVFPKSEKSGIGRKTLTGAESCALMALALLMLPVLTGGDHFKMFRFFQPVYPFLCLTLILLLRKTAMDRLWDAGAGNIFKTGLLSLVFLCWLFAFSAENAWSPFLKQSPLKHEFGIAERGMMEGRLLNRLFAGQGESLPAVGVVTSGGIARNYSGPLVDLMGLNNIEIAHSPGNRKGIKNHAAFQKDYFFQNEPDLLMASPPRKPEFQEWADQVMKGLYDDPEFINRWRFGRLALGDDPDAKLKLFVQQDYLEQLRKATNIEFKEFMVYRDRWVDVRDLPAE